VEVELILSDGSSHFASVPSGASTGVHEAVELRDGDENIYGGKSVFKALLNIDINITPSILGLDPTDQKIIDKKVREIDGTDNFSNVGANATLATSIAVLKAGAYSEEMPLYQYIKKMLVEEYDMDFPPNLAFPTPMFNIFNGGAHADDNIAIQEFMVVPTGITDVREKIRAGSEIFHELRKLLKERNIDTDVGNEGGFAPNLPSDNQVFELIMEAIKKADYKPKDEIWIALDVAISQYYDAETETYDLPHQERDGEVTNIKGDFKAIAEYYVRLSQKYPIYSIEDGMYEDDWLGFATLKPLMNSMERLCVGDDLTVTNTDRIRKAIEANAINAVIIKPNQIGQVSLTFDAIKLCRENDIKVIVSHRSGDTADTFISHLAVGAQAEFLKAGAPQRSERVEKYNELLRMITPEMARKQIKEMEKN
jgi:enolase